MQIIEITNLFIDEANLGFSYKMIYPERIRLKMYKGHPFSGVIINHILKNTWSYRDGKPHCATGPAIIEIYDESIEESWYYNGVSLPEEEWFECLTSDEKREALWNLTSNKG